MRITFKVFDSKLASREKLFKAAVDFANMLPQDQLITITHSEDRDNTVITIWYRTDEPEKTLRVKPGELASSERPKSSPLLPTPAAPSAPAAPVSPASPAPSPLEKTAHRPAAGIPLTNQPLRRPAPPSHRTSTPIRGEPAPEDFDDIAPLPEPPEEKDDV